jgi:hypothetical protein
MSNTRANAAVGPVNNLDWPERVAIVGIWHLSKMSPPPAIVRLLPDGGVTRMRRLTPQGTCNIFPLAEDVTA